MKRISLIIMTSVSLYLCVSKPRRPDWSALHPRPVDHRRVRRQVLYLRHRRRRPHLRRRMGLVRHRRPPQAGRTGRAGTTRRRCCPRRAEAGRPLPLHLRCHGRRTRRRPQRPHPHHVEQDPRPHVAPLQVDGARGGVLLRRSRRPGRHRPRPAARPHHGAPLGQLRHLLRHHPPHRARPHDGLPHEGQQGARHRHRLRGHRPHLPRRLVLSAGHTRHLLRRCQLHL